MKKIRVLAIVLACVLVIGMLLPAGVAEETTVIVTSPFTAAIAEVRSSVVVVNNYQMINYGNYGNYGYNNYFDYFGFGFGGFGNGFGNYGRGNNGNNQNKSEEVRTGFGSGVVIADDYVLTNYHVVEDASRVTISIPDYDTGDAQEMEASVAGYDANLDLAVVYVPNLDLKPVKIGDSDALQVGDWSICIGNPLSANYYGTVTVGIVSALNRTISSSSYDKYGRKETTSVAMIQTDADINSGNSGGGMFNVLGELVGVPARKSSGTSSSGIAIDGISLCIPINLAKDLISNVVDRHVTAVDGGEFTPTATEEPDNSNSLIGKPRLGITITSLNTSSTAIVTGLIPNGAYVSAVEENSPAAAAGMETGDVIVEVNDTIINNATMITEIVGNAKEGDVLHIRVFRVEGGLNDETTEEQMQNGTYVDLDATLRIVDAVNQ